MLSVLRNGLTVQPPPGRRGHSGDAWGPVLCCDHAVMWSRAGGSLSKKRTNNYTAKAVTTEIKIQGESGEQIPRK